MARPSVLALPFLLILGAACRDGNPTYRDLGVPVDDSGAPEEDGGLISDSGVEGPDTGLSFDAIVLDGAGLDAGRDGGVLPDGGGPGDASGGPDGGGTGLEPGPGDLVFVEIQGNPQGTADTDAEYFELLNVSGRALDLEGCRLTHRQWAGSGMPPVDSVGNHRIGSSVPVPIGGRVLLTRSNGGFFGGASRDYVYSGFELSNGGADNNRIRLMAPSWDGNEPPDPSALVDEVITPAATFDNPVRGRAWQLDPSLVPNPSASNNDNAASWCHTSAVAGLAYWQSNWGTPGAANQCQ